MQPACRLEGLRWRLRPTHAALRRQLVLVGLLDQRPIGVVVERAGALLPRRISGTPAEDLAVRRAVAIEEIAGIWLGRAGKVGQVPAGLGHADHTGPDRPIEADAEGIKFALVEAAIGPD